MDKEAIKSLMDIGDLEGSRKNIMLALEIFKLNLEIDVLKEILIANKLTDSYGFIAVMQYVENKPEHQEILKTLTDCAAAINAAAKDPQARLKAMFEAKMAGKY